MVIKSTCQHPWSSWVNMLDLTFSNLYENQSVKTIIPLLCDSLNYFLLGEPMTSWSFHWLPGNYTKSRNKPLSSLIFTVWTCAILFISLHQKVNRTSPLSNSSLNMLHDIRLWFIKSFYLWYTFIIIMYCLFGTYFARCVQHK